MSTNLANFVNVHWLNVTLDVEYVAVEWFTVTPLELDESVPPDAYDPWNLTLLKYALVVLSNDTPAYATVFLSVMLDT